MSNLHYTNEVTFQNFKHLEVRVEPKENSVWIYLNPNPRSCITLTLLRELKIFQNQLKHYKGKLPYQGELVDIHYHIVSSRQSVFSFGGDLEHFVRCVEMNDAQALRDYGRACIDTMYPNLMGFDQGITTISLIHGNALGGGFEAALSSQVVIAEKKAEMGLPEVLFNLFPGMGAYHLLARRLNASQAEKIILSGRLYSAEEFYDMGIVDVLAENGEGELAVSSFIRANKNRRNSYQAMNKVRQCVNPIEYNQLIDICDIWVEAALNLTEKDKRTMLRLVNSQRKFANQANEIPLSKVTAL